jgi:RNA polymerase sigma factor (sigma-70 family)
MKHRPDDRDISPEMNAELDRIRPITSDEMMALVEKARAGDIAARNEMIERNLPLMRFLLRTRFKAENADEALQECAIEMMDRYLKYDPRKGRLSTYTYRQMSYILRGRRRSGNAVALGRDFTVVSIEVSGPDVAAVEAEEYDDIEEKVEKALKALDARYGDYGGVALAMKFGLLGYAPMGGAEIAKALGISPQAVSNRIIKAKRRLAQMNSVKALKGYIKE